MIDKLDNLGNNELCKENTTVVICCAGMGTRLGIGTTKALIQIDGKPLIIHLLEQLNDFRDVRIVLGYQAEKVIQVVDEYRKDVMFAFNYDYATTGVAASLSKGIIKAKEMVLYIDGDLIINPQDFKKFLDYPGECLAVSKINSDEQILVNVCDGLVTSFVDTGEVSWPGMAKIKSSNLIYNDKQVYNMIESLLPLPAVQVRIRGINTQNDYEQAVEWYLNGLK